MHALVARHAHAHELARVGDAGVFGDARVVEDRRVCGACQHHVFHDGAEADRVPDDRLAFRIQIDALGVAAALEIEYAVVVPAVLVVTDKEAGGIRRQRGLAGSGQTEEQPHVAAFADVGRAVHGQYAVFRREIVEHGEHGLFHFTGIAHAGQKDAPSGEVDDHRGVAGCAVARRIGGKGGQVQDGPLGARRFRRGGVRADEQLVREQAVPGVLRDDEQAQRVTRVTAGLKLCREQFAVLQPVTGAGPEVFEGGWIERPVDLAPVHFGVDQWRVDDVPVLRRTAGARSGSNAQRAIVGQYALAALKRHLHELGYRQIHVQPGAAQTFDQQPVARRRLGFKVRLLGDGMHALFTPVKWNTRATVIGGDAWVPTHPGGWIPAILLESNFRANRRRRITICMYCIIVMACSAICTRMQPRSIRLRCRSAGRAQSQARVGPTERPDGACNLWVSGTGFTRPDWWVSGIGSAGLKVQSRSNRWVSGIGGAELAPNRAGGGSSSGFAV